MRYFVVFTEQADLQHLRFVQKGFNIRSIFRVSACRVRSAVLFQLEVLVQKQDALLQNKAKIYSAKQSVPLEETGKLFPSTISSLFFA